MVSLNIICSFVGIYLVNIYSGDWTGLGCHVRSVKPNKSKICDISDFNSHGQMQQGVNEN